MAEKEPVHKIPFGRIQCAIWENVNQDGESWFNVTIERRYRVDDEWRGAPSFRAADLLIAAKALDKAFDWIWERQQTKQSNEVES